MDVLLIIGLVIFAGTLSGKLFQWLKIPQVVGYIVTGVLLGRSGANVLNVDTIEIFTPVINIALGFIGFRIGAELKGEVFKKYGRTIYSILLGEGLFAFFIVAVVVTLLTGKVYLGLLLGAIASATAPAATTDVLWEYKTRGPLTSTLLAIVALDDGLSLIIYSFASVFALSIMKHTSFSLWNSVVAPVGHLASTCLLGGAIGFGLFKLLGHIKDKDRILSFSVAAVIFTVGAAISLKLDFILAAMSLGAVFSNMSGKEGHTLFSKIEDMTPPIFILFFVLVGARLQVKLFMNFSITLLALVYLLGRTSGKMAGAWFGAYISRAQSRVRKYLGMCLFSQAGVAIGLAMVIYHNFSLLGPEGEAVGAMVINIITATTFVVQIIGPPSVKFAVAKADEMYRNVTREDVVALHKVGDLMQKEFAVIKENDTLDKILKTVREYESYYFPVVNQYGEITGVLSLSSLRGAFMEQQLSPIVMASDISVDVDEFIYPDRPLQEAMEIFEKREMNFFLPVVENKMSNKIVGILEYDPLIKELNVEVLERQEAAYSMS